MRFETVRHERSRLRWDRAGICVTLAALAACSAPQGFAADRSHCLPVVEAPANAYPAWEETACQDWNAAQAVAFEANK